MYNPDEINKKLQSFEKRLELANFSTVKEKLNYLTIYRQILDAEQMPEEELIRRAKAIKPLVRLEANGIRRDFADFADDDYLVFIEPVDIRQSYIYNFSEADIIVEETDNNEITPLPIPELTEITSFTCYHKYGGYYGFFRPGADEVLSQIPPDVDIDQVSAFEIKVASLDLDDTYNCIYDGILDRHVTTVILYAMKGGLPIDIASQKVICDGKTY